MTELGPGSGGAKIQKSVTELTVGDIRQCKCWSHMII